MNLTHSLGCVCSDCVPRPTSEGEVHPVDCSCPECWHERGVREVEKVLATAPVNKHPFPPPPRRLLTTLTSEQRKEYPIVTGVLDYFPDAIAMVAHVSYKGNQKHNPGQPLHWARGKSMDHEDCIGRHTIERDALDGEIYHAANRAWRALAACQELAEKVFKLDPPRGVR